MFESLIEPVAASDWVYLLLLSVAALDAVFPLVPSEAAVMVAAALAGAGDPLVLFVLLSGAAGAVLGDNVAYWIGRAGGRVVLARLIRSPSRRRGLELVEGQLRRRGGTIIVVSRFVPGGRTAAMLSAGVVGLGWRRFLAFDVAACVLWASYASLLGWVGGRTFSDEPIRALLLAFGIAMLLVLVIEMARRVFRPRRSSSLEGEA